MGDGHNGLRDKTIDDDETALLRYFDAFIKLAGTGILVEEMSP